MRLIEKEKLKSINAIRGKHFKEVSDEVYDNFIMQHAQAWEIIEDMSKPERWLMRVLLSTRDYRTNECKLRFSSLNATERTYYSRAIKSITERPLIHKLSSGVYLINPEFIYPVNKYRVTKVWDKLMLEKFNKEDK